MDLYQSQIDRKIKHGRAVFINAFSVQSNKIEMSSQPVNHVRCKKQASM